MVGVSGATITGVHLLMKAEDLTDKHVKVL